MTIAMLMYNCAKFQRREQPMKCPHCGHEMPDGYLLCDKCGEEIQIVPDFEPEIENSITETLSTLVSQQEETDEAETADGESETVIGAGKRSRKPQVILSLAILFLAAIISYALYAYHIHTADYQINKAMSYAEKGAYSEAIACLEAAYADYPEEARILFWRRIITICSRWTIMRCWLL